MPNIQDEYYQWAQEHPIQRGALSLLPGVGQAMATWDYERALRDGNQMDGAFAAASMIPGYGLLKAGRSALIPTLDLMAPRAQQAVGALANVMKSSGTGFDIGQAGTEAMIPAPGEPTLYATLPPPRR